MFGPKFGLRFLLDSKIGRVLALFGIDCSAKPYIKVGVKKIQTIAAQNSIGENPTYAHIRVRVANEVHRV